MKISAMFCIDCGDKIYSRARHDMRRCSCGNIAVDGGFDYCKYSFKNSNWLHCIVNVPGVSKKILFDDWNTGKNKYGLII